jgi:hypothetical protein
VVAFVVVPKLVESVNGYEKLEPPAASFPSHRSAEPVIEVQKSDQELPVTPPKVKDEVAESEPKTPLPTVVEAVNNPEPK